MATGFGSAVRRVRKGLGLSQEELGERALLSARTIGAIENGAQGRPRPATVQALIAALADDPDAAEALASAWRADGAKIVALPLAPTPIVGRNRALDTLIAALRGGGRVISVTGPAGVGKTRLALEAAHRVAAEFERAAFVELADVASPADALRALAAPFAPALGDDPVADLARAIGGTRCLLVVDSAEHLVRDVAPAVSRLAATPGPAILVTTRIPLGVRAERVIPVEPLAVDDAVALLRARAEAAGAPPANDAALAAIAERLDRLPLALELVAPRLLTLEPAALLERLRERLPLLVDGAPDLPERQRTLSAAIAWSYELLPDADRSAFRALGVFAGGWTLEAAEALLGPDALATLERLLRAQLVQRVAGLAPTTRFFVLQTVMEFARNELARRPLEHAAARAAHLSWTATFVQRAVAALSDAAVLGALDAEIENICAAIANGIADRGFDEVLELVRAGRAYWLLRGRAAEAAGCLRRLLAVVDGAGTAVPPQAIAAAYVEYAELARAAGIDLRAALTGVERAVVLATAAGDEATSARAFAAALGAAILVGDAPRAERAAAEALSIGERIDDAPTRAAALAGLGALAEDGGDLDAAEARFRDAAAAFAAAGDDAGRALAQTASAGLTGERGDVSAARVALRGALRLARVRNDESLRIAALRRIARTARLADRPRTAAIVGAIAAHRAAQRHAPDEAVLALEEAAFALADSAPDLAVRAFGAAERFLRDGGRGRLPRRDADVERAAAALRQRLGPVTFDILFATGRHEGADRVTADILREGARRFSAA